MKKNRSSTRFWIFILLVALFGLIYKIKFKSIDIVGSNVSHPKLNPLDESEKTERSTKNSEVATTSPPRKLDVATDTETADADEQVMTDCWRRISGQANAEEFLATNKQAMAFTHPWILNNKLVEVSEQPERPSQFFEALAEVNLLSGRRRPLNQNEALKSLISITESDPENAAPLVYLAIIYEQKGDQQNLQSTIEKLKQTKFFDSYVTTLARSLHGLVQSPHDLPVVIEFLSQLPIPDWIPVREFLIKHNLASVAQLMIKANYLKEPQIEFLDTVLVEYSMGISILKKM